MILNTLIVISLFVVVGAIFYRQELKKDAAQLSSDSGSQASNSKPQSSDNIMSMLDWTVLPPRYFELVSMRLTLRADEPTSQPTIEPMLIERIREEVAVDLAKKVGERCEKSLDSYAAGWYTADGKKVTREDVFGLMRMADKQARVLVDAAEERVKTARAEVLKIKEEAALAAARADTTQQVPAYKTVAEYEQEEKEQRSQPLTLATASR